MAAIAYCAVAPDGPLFEPMSETVIVAASFDQGKVIFDHLVMFMKQHTEADKSRYKVWDSNNLIVEDKRTKTRVRVLSQNPRTMHGIQAKLLLLDELAQWEHTKIEQSLAALQTSLGKIEGSRILAIGTRPATSDHPFEKMLTSGGADFAMNFAARPDDKPFQRRTWKRANPSLDAMPVLEAAIRKAAEEARKDESALPQFEAYRLNLGISDVAIKTLLDAATWQRCEALPVTERADRYVLAIDLGQNESQSAAAAYWPESGHLDAFAVFPENPSLAERGLRDGVGSLYNRMNDRGELHTAGNRVSDVGYLLRTALKRFGVPRVIVADSWRRAQLIEELEAIHFPITELVDRRQGFYSMSDDIYRFRTACLADKVRPPKSLLMRAAIGESRVKYDDAGNCKLVKIHSGGGKGFKPKDDVAVASVMAVGEGTRRFSGNVQTEKRELRFSSS